MDDDAPPVRRGRLCTLLSTLQSTELALALEVSAELVSGDGRGRWAAVALLEAWKASCRLRLLQLQPAGELMRSLPADAPVDDPERWGNALRRTGLGARLCERAGAKPYRAAPSADGAPSPTLRMRWPRARGLGLDDDDDAEADAAAAAAAAAGAPTAARAREMSVGEALHIAQPLVYLALFLLRHRRDLGASRHGAGRRRSGAAALLADSAPWLAAVAIELVALRLCTRAAARRRGASAAAPPPPPPEGRTAALVAAADACVRWVVGGGSDDALSDAADEELRHRRWLVALFAMRPAALGAVRLLLAGVGERTRGAAEMVDSLDSRFWLRC